MRRVFTLIAALSAVICLAFILMWVRGIFGSDVWASHLYTSSDRSLRSRSIELSNGWLLVVRSTTIMPPGTVPQPPPPVDATWVHGSGPPNMPSNFAPDGPLFTWYSATPTPGPSTPRSFHIIQLKVAGVRLLLVIALSSLLPALWIWLRIRRGRAGKVGCCPVCGYDMRASPQRCPECGTVRAKGAEISNRPTNENGKGAAGAL